jgi:hypothetical protein
MGRDAEAPLAGFGGSAGADARQTVRLLARSQRATRYTGTHLGADLGAKGDLLKYSQSMSDR